MQSDRRLDSVRDPQTCAYCEFLSDNDFSQFAPLSTSFNADFPLKCLSRWGGGGGGSSNGTSFTYVVYNFVFLPTALNVLFLKCE